MNTLIKELLEDFMLAEQWGITRKKKRERKDEIILTLSLSPSHKSTWYFFLFIYVILFFFLILLSSNFNLIIIHLFLINYRVRTSPGYGRICDFQTTSPHHLFDCHWWCWWNQCITCNLLFFNSLINHLFRGACKLLEGTKRKLVLTTCNLNLIQTN